jgi:hypothetical protein
MDLTGPRESQRSDVSSLDIAAGPTIRRDETVKIALLQCEAQRSEAPT